MIMLKVTKKLGFHPFSEKHIFQKHKEGRQIDPLAFSGLSSCKISRKLPITESDYGNVASATLLKLLSVVHIFLLLEEFPYIFLKEYLG